MFRILVVVPQFQSYASTAQFSTSLGNIRIRHGNTLFNRHINIIRLPRAWLQLLAGASARQGRYLPSCKVKKDGAAHQNEELEHRSFKTRCRHTDLLPKNSMISEVTVDLLFFSKACDAAFRSRREAAMHPRVIGLTLRWNKTKLNLPGFHSEREGYPALPFLCRFFVCQDKVSCPWCKYCHTATSK